ncbi:HAMP domain-containing sensor histidine kinase [Dactylosporangium sp. AC04546]|uniref:sensor histidine kinase n=1 Tax=Dactylosporangium sp. AC04546 TaxID=2862460 RepID=UPI001EE01846|nr:HAMP domain-containing sensor histidine kinase [Dactylosporangium sp. AC04546]WVK84918.1 HAMP domain-containing sensor histidine kinase [Dactylosporangium sp. AC04546]
MLRFIADVPLRVKLIAAVLTLVTMALLVIGVASALVMRSSMIDKVDQQLRTLADTVEISRLQRQSTDSESVLPSNYFILWATILPTNQVSYGYVGTRDPAAQPPPPASADELVSRIGEPYTVTTKATHERWRVLITQRGSTLLVICESLSMVDNAVDELVAAELFVGAGVLVVLAAVGVTIVRTSLQPLREIERTAAAIAAGDLTKRVPESPPETEMGHLAAALNTMLAQIEGAFKIRQASEERMRQFIADASHELRTPLTTIRGFAELYRQGAARQPDETGALLRRIEDEASRMGLLVEDLLMLARLDEERPLSLADMDLRVIASDAVAAARAVAPDRAIALEIERDEPIEVNGDEARLRQVVGNLVTNALTHTPAGSPVEMRLRRDGTDALIEVVDHGPGLTDEQAARVFERFYRVDKARTRRQAGGSHSGSGLGLAIVAALVAVHSGTVSVFVTPGGGATFQVRLPLTGGSQGAVSSPQAPAAKLKS